MRKNLAWLALITPCACGGRTLGDWSEQASGGAGSVSSGTTGGSVPFPGTGGVSSGGVSSGGVSSGSGGGPTNHSGAPSSGGAAAGGLAGGGLWSGGYASGGYAGGGARSGGSGGREACFEATQPAEGICIHVRLCSAAQYETLCLLDTPSTAVCFCYVDGAVKSAKSILSATAGTLCGQAVAAECP